MENCVRCGVSGEKVRLFDSVYSGSIEKICERCSIIENIPIIKRPDVSQLKTAEKPESVYERMRGLSGHGSSEKKDTFFRGDRLRELDQMPELELPEKNKLNLIEHFNWEIMRERRRKGLTPERLAENLRESSTAIIMLEQGKVPENAENLIKKLEQFFQVRLRKRSENEIMRERKSVSGPVLFDRNGNELERIPEPDYEADSMEIDEDKSKEILDLRGIDKERAEVDIGGVNLSQIRIGDLKELHRKRIESTKQEREEEKRRLEEKQKLVEARKEELRSMRERESKELDNYLGGAELLDKDMEEKSEEDLEED